MKLTTTSLTALVLSVADIEGAWWNPRINGPISKPDTSRSQPPRYLWNAPPPKFYQNKINTFKRPITPQNVNTQAPQVPQPNPEYNSFLSQALSNDQIRSSRPVPGPYDINTSKVKVRVSIQYNCGAQNTPSISSVQDRVNKDYVIRQLIGKKFSAVHVNRFRCSTPYELLADFIFYVYQEDKLGFPDILDSLKPSLCRATGVHHTEMAKTIRILPEQEIIEEAVNQVSTSISKAIATIGQQQTTGSQSGSSTKDLDASNIVDVAVNNIIEQDSTSVNNIVEDLVSVINSDREEVVSDLVSKVEDQIRKELNEKNTERNEVDETVKLVTEAMIEETALLEEDEEEEEQDSVPEPQEGAEEEQEQEEEAQNETENEIVAGILAVSEPTEAFDSTNILQPVIETEEEEDLEIDFSNEGDISDFLSGFVNLPDESVLDAIVENMQIQEEEEQDQEDDLKAVLLEVTQAPSLEQEDVVSAKDIVNAIMPEFIEESDDSEEEVSEAEASEQALNEFKDSLYAAIDADVAVPASQPQTPTGQAESPAPEDLSETSVNEVVSSILSVSTPDQPIRSSEEADVEEEENEIVSSILDASEQTAASPSESMTLPEELTSTVEIIEQTPEDEVDAFDLFEDISDLIEEEPSPVEDASAHDVLNAMTGLAGEETEGAGEKPLLETVNVNSTSIELPQEIISGANSTSSTSSEEKLASDIESIIKETEDSLIRDNIIENVVNSMVVEVPEDLVEQLALARANGNANSNSTATVTQEGFRSRGLDIPAEDDLFVNGVVESVMNFFIR